ncbi:MAG: hypothetical protein HS111_21630 [Kofleriaceae bacterium]|nr:hypothetical protein [Kofleriaceae bacterium]
MPSRKATAAAGLELARRDRDRGAAAALAPRSWCLRAVAPGARALRASTLPARRAGRDTPAPRAGAPAGTIERFVVATGKVDLPRAPAQAPARPITASYRVVRPWRVACAARRLADRAPAASTHAPAHPAAWIISSRRRGASAARAASGAGVRRPASRVGRRASPAVITRSTRALAPYW